MENSVIWLKSLINLQNAEVILFGLLALFTLWYIRNTINYYHAQKRKLKYMHRFAKEGDVEAQHYLAKKYREGEIVKKSCDQAAFWYQRAAFSGDEEAEGFLKDFFENHRKKC